MIKQIGLPLRGRPILLITRMITDRIGLHSVLLPLLIVIWIFYMGIKFREDLFSRVFNFAIFYNREKREIKAPGK